MSSSRNRRRLHNNPPFSNSDYTTSDDGGDVSGRETHSPPPAPSTRTYTDTHADTHTCTHTLGMRTRRTGVAAVSPHAYDVVQKQRKEFDRVRDMGKRKHGEGEFREDLKIEQREKKRLHLAFGFALSSGKEEGNESGPGSPPDPRESEIREEERQRQLHEIQHLEATILQLHEEREALEAKRRQNALAEKEAHAGPLLVDDDVDSLVALWQRHRHLSALRHTKVLAHKVAQATMDRVRLNQQLSRFACTSFANLPTEERDEGAGAEEGRGLGRMAELTERWMGLVKEKEEVRQQLVTAMQHFNECHTRTKKMGQTQEEDTDSFLRLNEQGELCRILYQKLLTGSVEFDPLEVGLPLSLPPPPEL